MTLLIILACVFGAVALMVVLGERFGSPVNEEQQKKHGKILVILVFISLIAGLIKAIL
jgi:hypothetical protein